MKLLLRERLRARVVWVSLVPPVQLLASGHKGLWRRVEGTPPLIWQRNAMLITGSFLTHLSERRCYPGSNSWFTILHRVCACQTNFYNAAPDYMEFIQIPTLKPGQHWDCIASLEQSRFLTVLLLTMNRGDPATMSAHERREPWADTHSCKNPPFLVLSVQIELYCHQYWRLLCT